MPPTNWNDPTQVPDITMVNTIVVKFKEHHEAGGIHGYLNGLYADVISGLDSLFVDWTSPDGSTTYTKAERKSLAPDAVNQIRTRIRDELIKAVVGTIDANVNAKIDAFMAGAPLSVISNGNIKRGL